jgi:hypothetical protein
MMAAANCAIAQINAAQIASDATNAAISHPVFMVTLLWSMGSIVYDA